MSSVKVCLNTSSPCKDGTYPLAIQLIHNRCKKIVRISYSLFKEDFDARTGKAMYREGVDCYSYTERELNDYLLNELSSFNDVIDYLQEFKPMYDVADAVQLYKINRKTPLVVVFAAKLANTFEQKGRKATANAYKSALKKVISYNSGHLLRFEEMNSEWLQVYQDFLIKDKLKENSVFFYLRILRVIYKKAQKMGIASLAQNPFVNQRYQSEKVQKDVLTNLDIATLTQATFAEKDRLELARDLFLFSYYACGMSYMDMAYLKKNDINGDVLCYMRNRNKKKTSVTITPYLRMLISKYIKSDSQFILPIFDSKSYGSFDDYRKKLRVYNSQLKRLSEKLELSCPLNSYVAQSTSSNRESVGEITLSLVSKGKKSVTKIAYNSLDEAKVLLLNVLDELNQDNK